MAFLRQTWALTRKNLLIVFTRHWLSTIIQAFLFPVIYMFIIAYAKNFFIPPANYGVGTSTPVRDLSNALNAADASRHTVAFVHNGYTGGQIEALIDQLADPIRATGKDVQILGSDRDLLTVCRNSLRGASGCYGAASFYSSPTEGPAGVWNYTIRADGALGRNIYVDRDTNDAEIYVLPFQHAIDAAISNGTLPSEVNEYPFTSRTAKQRQDTIRVRYMGTIINILAVVYFVGIVGVAYQLTGQMATERELGMSQLIEAMTPNSHRWHTQAARLLSYHLAFDIIYFPGWLLVGIIVARLVFPTSSVGVPLGLHLLAGFSMTSFSILGASLFRKAQLSGISVTIVSILLAIIAQVVGPNSSSAVAILSLLFPPMNYTFSIVFMARWERQTLPTNLGEGAPDSPWQLPGIVFWIFLILQIFVFPVLGGVIERSLYGTGSKARKMNLNSEDGSKAVRLVSFSKHYPPGWWQRNVVARLGGKRAETVVAVNNLSLTALRGQIMVLLGANGSGKSTTLDAIAGLNTITSGTIEVDGTGGLGLCPQKNVLWDELTVYEHVDIFNGLKATTARDSKAQTCDLIRHCDLDLKLNAKSKTLSGGQKRKLQLAMMFTGGSRVCCVDEVSSGLDPLSRRKIWDILLAERGFRTLLLTTHFLDEADVLSDYITILSKGNLKAEGSAVELKHKFGGGYRVRLHSDQRVALPGDLTGLRSQRVHDQVVYQLASSAEAAQFVSTLERDGICDYQVNGPTIEDVFLKLAEEVKEDPAESNSAMEQASMDAKSSADGAYQPEPLTETKSKEDALELSTGKGTSVPRQTWVLFRKRFTVLRRNYWPYCFAVLIPVVAAGLVTMFLKGFSALSCDPESQSSTGDLFLLNTRPKVLAPVGPPDRVPSEALARRFQQNVSSFPVMDTLDDFNTYISHNYANVTPGGFFLGNTPVFAYVANYDIYYSVLTQNILDNVLIDTPIVTQYQQFATPWSPSAGDTLQLIFYFGLAMVVYPAFFALYPTLERLRKVRALHYSNGIRTVPLWLAYVLFDFIFVLLISLLVTIIWVSISNVWYAPGYLFVVFFLYGLASILFSYIVSLFASSQLAAFAVAAGAQAVFFLLYFVTYMCILTYIPQNQVDRDITIAHFTIALIPPSANFLRTMLLTLNEFSLLCRGESVASYPGDITVYGGPILYLVVQTILLFIFLVWRDSGYRPDFLNRASRRASDPEDSSTHQDREIGAELVRVQSSSDPLRVLHLSKSFGSNMAVDDITFGVARGEVFALLGPNGAGKSTTISLIRGDIRPSNRNGGDILVEGISIIRNRAAARSHLGVCPQFDAMDQMSTLEHLRFYARARGVPDVEHNVAAVIAAVGLEPFKNRMAAALSGGNKRKLSLGIALMGNPSVLLLDEPSSGMDAASKRVMWKTLNAVTAGRSLVITTHSMEEADALADRAGIMAGRMLALGTSEELRRKWGDGWYVHVVQKSAPHTSQKEMQNVKEWVALNIPGAVVDEKSFHGQLRFRVPAAFTGHPDSEGSSSSSSRYSDPALRSGITALFSLLETHKEELGFEYYSVSQATLDQVFLAIVGKHNVEEENQRDKRPAKRGIGATLKEALESAL